MDFAPFLGWKTFRRMKKPEMLLQVWYGFSSTTMSHIYFIRPLFLEWILLDFVECHKIILAFMVSEPFSSSEEGAFVPTKVLSPGSSSIQ